MKKPQLLLMVILYCAIINNAVAAKPVKITPGKKGVSAVGENFRVYTVSCSNGKKQPVTSWKNGKQWCVGHSSLENCSKKQIKAAKNACKL